MRVRRGQLNTNDRTDTADRFDRRTIVNSNSSSSAD
jgi:hypothetical protein